MQTVMNKQGEIVSKRETAKRYILFIISLFFMGLGVALTKHGELGVSPISSVANVVSIKFTFLSFGTWIIVSNFVLIIGQMILLRRDFKPIQFLQIPLSFLFGYFTDFGLWLVREIPNDIYIARIMLVLAGVIVLGFGITLGVIADVILNSGEAIIKAIADVTGKNFGSVKIVFDVLWVMLSVVLSLLFFEGRLVGTREGTIISALLGGVVIKLFRPLLQKPLTKILEK
ncbi:MAG: YitT family protein [Ruminococcaceae bacterium]|nr:YitT family protein [Oscillospiraceae bacterium]